MERLVLRYQVLMQALDTLKEPIEYIGTVEKISVYKMIRDSAIQRFEYCFDDFWKFLKQYLEVFHALEIKSPRETFKRIHELGIVDENEARDLLRLIDDRNLTSHGYKEYVADQVYNNIVRHLDVMENIAYRLGEKLIEQKSKS